MFSTPISGYELRCVYQVLIRGYSYKLESVSDNLNQFYHLYLPARRLRSILEKLESMKLVERSHDGFKKGKRIPKNFDLLMEEVMIPTPVKESLRIRILNKIEQWVK